MNKKFLAAVFSAAVLVTACKKSDVQQTAVNTPAVAAASVSSSNWKSLSSWNSQPQEKYTTYSNKISDSTISAAVAGKGLVLVYKKSGTDISALPFEEKGTSNFWYYQVSQGRLVVLVDTYGTTAAPAQGQSIKYFVLSADKLNELQSKGYSKAELMKLSYENAIAILN
ncbi:MAG: hypothetical protein ACJ75B_10795 [Flavisolibacter sp.]